MSTSAAWRRKTLYPAAAMAFRLSSVVVVLIVSTDLMRKGSMIVRNTILERGYQRAPAGESSAFGSNGWRRRTTVTVQGAFATTSCDTLPRRVRSAEFARAPITICLLYTSD